MNTNTTFARTRFATIVSMLLIAAAVLSPAKSAVAQTYVAIDLFTLATPFPGQPGPQFNFSLFGPSIAARGQVVGYADLGPNVAPFNRALLWSGPTGASIDLTPTQFRGFGSAAIDGTDGVQQVGSAGQSPTIQIGTGFSHAMLWSGTAHSRRLT